MNGIENSTYLLKKEFLSSLIEEKGVFQVFANVFMFLKLSGKGGIGNAGGHGSFRCSAGRRAILLGILSVVRFFPRSKNS